MTLSSVEQALIVAAYFRGRPPNHQSWGSNSDQVLTLSLFYTGDISSDDCVRRFSQRSYISNLYDADGQLTDEIAARYFHLIRLLRLHGGLIQGGGDLQIPADPTYTACGLTDAGVKLACFLIPKFPTKPEFPDWPDNRTFPLAP